LPPVLRRWTLVALCLLGACSGGADHPTPDAAPRPLPVGDIRVPAKIRNLYLRAVRGDQFVSIRPNFTDATAGELSVTHSIYRTWSPGSAGVETLPAPPIGQRFAVEGLGADDDGFVVWGERCDDHPPGDEVSCSPGTPLSYRLDPDAQQWHPLAIPARLARSRHFTLSLRRSGAGMEADVQESPDGPRHALVLVGDRWEDRGSFHGAVDDMCATRDAIYTFSQTGATMLRPLTDETTTTVIREVRPGRPPKAVALPQVSKRFNGAGVRLACDAHAAYLSSADGLLGARAELTIYRYAGGRWAVRSRAEVDPAQVVGAVLSEPTGVAYVWATQTSTPAVGSEAFAASATRPLRRVAFTRDVESALVDGTSGRVLAFSGQGEGMSEPDAPLGEVRPVFR
jgi:hypothetical protein